MFDLTIDLTTLAFVVGGAFLAGFTTGFAGFGTGLVASGFWFHVLPAGMVPPLVVLASVAGQFISLITLRRSFNWPRALPFLLGGVIGVPFGVALLAVASPGVLRASIGVFLILYATFQLFAKWQGKLGGWGGRPVDGLIGVGGGFLGGFSGLSGPLPLIWLQLRGGPSESQRTIYQPFNLLILTFTSAAMALAGQVDKGVLDLALISLPATIFGAWIGARVYGATSEAAFQRLVLGLLLLSGAVLLSQVFGLA
ncbi:MAG: sulfite exporter TauE/SafE family protein [Pseudomonadota bacterium]